MSHEDTDDFSYTPTVSVLKGADLHGEVRAYSVRGPSFVLVSIGARA